VPQLPALISPQPSKQRDSVPSFPTKRFDASSTKQCGALQAGRKAAMAGLYIGVWLATVLAALCAWAALAQPSTRPWQQSYWWGVVWWTAIWVVGTSAVRLVCRHPRGGRHRCPDNRRLDYCRAIFELGDSSLGYAGSSLRDIGVDSMARTVAQGGSREVPISPQNNQNGAHAIGIRWPAKTRLAGFCGDRRGDYSFCHGLELL
jgi:hypothetical protein